MVQVVAPPGYGKTTALAQWADVDGRQFGWVQLDDSHNDPATLLADIAAAASGDGREGALSAALTGLGEGRTADATAELARLLGEAEAGVLVLDDLHVLRRSAALQIVVVLAAALPPEWMLVIASRRQPRMGAGRLRSHGELVELGPDDLALDPQEVGDLFRRLGVSLPAPETRMIVARTEGWPAGVYLSGLSLVGRPHPAEAAAEITGSSQYIVDYFLDEVLAQQSAPAIRFLLRTSVLDRMCGSLCDAVLDSTGSAAWLTELRALNLFIVPEDDHGEWFRYHRLFAETLKSELRRREPGEEDRVCRRASAWYEEHGRPDEAIRYALAGQDQAAAARMITAYAQRFTSEGRVRLVRNWLDALDEQVVATYPPLAAMAAWIWALTGDGPRALWALRHAESADYDGPMPDESVSLESAVRRARAGLAPHGLQLMRADAEAALRLEPPGSPWHTMAALLLGTAGMLLGDRETAVRQLERAARLGRDTAGPGTSFALAQRALLAVDEGDWATATACAYDARTRVDSAGLQTTLTSLPTYVACARIRLHQGETQLAGIDTAIALRLYRRPSPAAFPWLAAQMAIQLGGLLLALGDRTGAETKAQEAGRYLPILGTAPVLLDQRLQLVTALDRTPTRAVSEGAALTAAELRILPLLPTHLSLAEIAGQLVLSRNTIKTQVAAIYRKLEASNRTEAVRRANELGLLDADGGAPVLPSGG